MDEALGPGQVLRTSGTENNLIGVPLTLLRASGRERIAVIEFGMNAPGEIWRLTEIAEPDVGVVTCVAPAHLEGLGSIAAVAGAKGELYRRLKPGATAVVNGDDTWVREIAQSFTGRTVYFGNDSQVAAEGIVARELDGTDFTLVVGGERRPLRLPLPGRHNVTNALAAAPSRSSAVPHSTRSSRDWYAHHACRCAWNVTLPGGVTVINDAYNANVASMRSALAMLGAMGEGARIAVLGEMRELGEESAALHREVGRAAAAEQVNVLIVVGSEAEEVRAGALESGMERDATLVAESPQEAAAWVRERAWPGDFVLIKDHAGPRMERVLSHLQEGRSAAGCGAIGKLAMLYLLLYPLHTTYSGLNVFKYTPSGRRWQLDRGYSLIHPGSGHHTESLRCSPGGTDDPFGWSGDSQEQGRDPDHGWHAHPVLARRRDLPGRLVAFGMYSTDIDDRHRHHFIPLIILIVGQLDLFLHATVGLLYQARYS